MASSSTGTSGVLGAAYGETANSRALNSALFSLPGTMTWDMVTSVPTGPLRTHTFNMTGIGGPGSLSQIFTYTSMHYDCVYPSPHPDCFTVDWSRATSRRSLLETIFGTDMMNANSTGYRTFTNGELNNFYSLEPVALPFGVLTAAEHYQLTGFTLWVCLTTEELDHYLRTGQITTSHSNFNFSFTGRAAYLWALKHLWTRRTSSLARHYNGGDTLNLLAFRMQLTTLTSCLMEGLCWMWNRHYIDFSLVYAAQTFTMSLTEARSTRLFRMPRMTVNEALNALEAETTAPDSRFALHDYLPLPRDFNAIVVAALPTLNRRNGGTGNGTGNDTDAQTGPTEATGSSTGGTMQFTVNTQGSTVNIVTAPEATGARPDTLEAAQVLAAEAATTIAVETAPASTGTRTPGFMYEEPTPLPTVVEDEDFTVWRPTATPRFRDGSTAP